MLPIKYVMLIDDDSISNMINQQIMIASKFALRVDSYTDGNIALTYLEELIKSDHSKFPEVIFVDINMPEMDGWKFSNELSKFPEYILDKCRVYMLTSSIDKIDIEKSENNKIIRSFISKPITVDKLGLFNNIDKVEKVEQHKILNR